MFEQKRSGRAQACAAALLVILGLSGCAQRAAAGSIEQDQQAVAQVLDQLHRRAADADGDGYFALYRQGAVFLGTDRDEYWPLAAFEAYARKRFDSGQGWTYVPTERFIHLNGDTAWFEERLKHARYGETRGTGVLVREADGWRIAQYNLTLPIPNAIFDDVTARIDQHYRERRR